MKILIVKLSAIGDVIHCLPVAAALKAALPSAHVTWLVDRGSADLLLNNPCVDDVLTFEGKSWSKDLKSPGNWLRIASESSAFFRDLRARGFDVALEMQGLFKSGALALASGARIRMGFNGTREFAESFLTHRIDVGDYFGHDVPVVELNLKIVSALLKLLRTPEAIQAPVFKLPPVTAEVRTKIESLLGREFVVSLDGNLPGQFKHIRNDDETATELASAPSATAERSTGAFSSSGIGVSAGSGASGSSTSVNLQSAAPDATSVPDSMPLPPPHSEMTRPSCVLIPGTTWVTKIWPEQQWYQLGVELARKYNYRLLIIGSRAEAEANASLCHRLNANRIDTAVDLTNKTSLLDLAALFRCTDLVVGGDTGPLHLAAAVGTGKVVGVYGSTPWRRNGPYGELCRSVSLQLACQPCYSKHCKIRTIECLRDLTVDKVMAVVDQIRGVKS